MSTLNIVSNYIYILRDTGDYYEPARQQHQEAIQWKVNAYRGAYVRTATETNLCTYTHIPTFTYRNLFTHSSPIEICIISVLVKWQMVCVRYIILF